jgi:ferritin
MINKKIETAINKQINAELYSAYLYLSMESYFHSKNLRGFANWMRTQALEEFTHADRLYKHVIDRGGRVIMDAIAKPPSEWKSPSEVFDNSYKHEQAVTKLIHNLMELAESEKDHAAKSMLQWFVDEQVEEEASADEIVQKIKMMKGMEGGLFMLDKELAQRVFTPSTDTKEG